METCRRSTSASQCYQRLSHRKRLRTWHQIQHAVLHCLVHATLAEGESCRSSRSSLSSVITYKVLIKGSGGLRSSTPTSHQATASKAGQSTHTVQQHNVIGDAPHPRHPSAKVMVEMKKQTSFFFFFPTCKMSLTNVQDPAGPWEGLEGWPAQGCGKAVGKAVGENRGEVDQWRHRCTPAGASALFQHQAQLTASFRSQISGRISGPQEMREPRESGARATIGPASPSKLHIHKPVVPGIREASGLDTWIFTNICQTHR